MLYVGWIGWVIDLMGVVLDGCLFLFGGMVVVL